LLRSRNQNRQRPNGNRSSDGQMGVFFLSPGPPLTGVVGVFTSRS
jgi:hypothetical protein